MIVVTSQVGNAASNPRIERYRAFIFDCDDTIIETARLRWSVLIDTAASCGIDLSEETIRAAWGKPFPELISALVPASARDDFLARYQPNMLLHRPNSTKGAVQLLSYLRSRERFLQIVTSSSKDLVLQDLRELGIDHYFDEIYGHGQTEYHKPDPRVLTAPLQALRGVGISTRETVYVGDSIRDFQAAAGNNIDFVCVLTGIETRDEVLAAGIDPSVIIDDLVALLPQEIGRHA